MTPPHSKTFRLDKTVLYQGIGFSIFFLTAILLHASVPFIPDPIGEAFAWEGSAFLFIAMGAALYGTMLLLALATWRAYLVEQLTLDGMEIRFRSLWQKHAFDLTEIETLRWKEIPRGGSLAIGRPGATMRLDLGNYAKEDRLEIIERLRTAVPLQRQEGWSKFCLQIALPLRDGIEPREIGLKENELAKLVGRRRRVRKLTCGLFASALLLVPLLKWLGVDEFTALTIAISLNLSVLILIVGQSKPSQSRHAQQQQVALELWEQGELVPPEA